MVFLDSRDCGRFAQQSLWDLELAISQRLVTKGQTKAPFLSEHLVWEKIKCFWQIAGKHTDRLVPQVWNVCFYWLLLSLQSFFWRRHLQTVCFLPKPHPHLRGMCAPSCLGNLRRLFWRGTGIFLACELSPADNHSGQMGRKTPWSCFFFLLLPHPISLRWKQEKTTWWSLETTEEGAAGAKCLNLKKTRWVGEVRVFISYEVVSSLPY